MKWRQLGAYIFATEPDPLKNFWPPQRRLCKLILTACAIAIGQILFAQLVAAGAERRWWSKSPFGIGGDIIAFYGGMLIAVVLQFLSLRRGFHPAIATIFALFLAIGGTVLSVMAFVARYGE
jgi:hypothetical protein